MSSNYGDEDDFMNNLLADMDESLLRTPTKPAPPPSTSRNKQKPVARPDFSQKSKDGDPELLDSSATPDKPAPESTVTFTPTIPGPKETFITQLPDGTPLLDLDPIEGSPTPTPPPPAEVRSVPLPPPCYIRLTCL